MLEDRIEITKNGCWIWKDQAFAIRIGSTFIAADRLTYALYVEDLPTGLKIEKTCRRKRCINPEHMRVDKRVKTIGIFRPKS
ncbi:MAG: hypothetical protein LPL29_14465 [Alphaproteobacteria bacterium]|nr:hypothetical protein [Alphaproteobacteria bacterium]